MRLITPRENISEEETLRENKSEEERNAEVLRMRALRENESEEERNAERLRMRALRENKSEEERKAEYNDYRCNEVAIVFASRDVETPVDRYILGHLRLEDTVIPKTRRIDYRHRNLNALSYPPLFSYREQTYAEISDAMAMVRKCGKLDLFISMTCNPKYATIFENPDANEKHENRPDLPDRSLDKNISELPNAHILITLKGYNKPRDAALIDKMNSAEIPNKYTHPELFSIITKNMIYEACGFTSYSHYMVENICSKLLPKIKSIHGLKSDGYPLYRRRKKDLVKIGKNHVDNSCVVPYNPYISLKYNFHINVDICASFKLSSLRRTKYIFQPAEQRIKESISNNIDSTLTALFEVYREYTQYCHLKSSEIPENLNLTHDYGELRVMLLKNFVIAYIGSHLFRIFEDRNGKTYKNFFKAAIAKELTTDENFGNETLNDALTMKIQKNIRDLFAYICLFNDVAYISKLWTNHKDNLIEECRRFYEHAVGEFCELCVSYVLNDTNMILNTHGKRCRDFGLEYLPTNLLLLCATFDEQEIFNYEETLNEEQRNALEHIIIPEITKKAYLYKALYYAIKRIERTIISDVIQSNLKHCFLWNNFNTLKLRNNASERQAGLEETAIEILFYMISKDIVKDIFGEVLTILHTICKFSKKVILAHTNEKVDTINQSVLDIL
ncbi:hypothetical protein CWI38_0120p0040 [Hamiltosporidium tvaerminnensis]|uniref:Helitron helicase-like domain-containing protein n=1 Tax=Hamiltosporidium tvaerminnensis TaxID=1176355 RepID=A0A4Q9M1Z2_9MICR|nr:hypothetical protein CWI38_0120p0040 [Hamiltosporidium tvaerminnensis]